VELVAVVAAMAIGKDVLDAAGDRHFGIATFTVRLGPRRAVGMGLAALSAGYLGMAVLGPLMVEDAQPWVLVVGHLVALATLWVWALRSDLSDQTELTRFYMRVWLLFLLEYALMPAAVLAG
jgi:homogentisate phytyltransferase/homogentisate geranylgeranyltransferase